MDENDTTEWFGNLSPLQGLNGSGATEHPICPTCGERMKSIMYGFPSHMPTEEDDYVLGGCVVFPGMPEFTCPTCAKD
jgi:hypothetical protein